MILRRDPMGSLIDTDRQIEFLAYKSFHGVVPVPEPLALETEGGALERPFFIMSRIDGGQVPSVMNLDPYGAHSQNDRRGTVCHPRPHRAAAIRRPCRCATASRRPAPRDCWRAALDEWQAVIERDERHPQPIVRAAIRRLRRNPPPGRRQDISVVHGDYRSGNVHARRARQDPRACSTGRWSHLGDAVEDLAWCFDPVVESFRRDAASPRRFPSTEAIAIWERESGLAVDPAALRWWKLFTAVKGCAIWTTSAKEFVRRRPRSRARLCRHLHRAAATTGSWPTCWSGSSRKAGHDADGTAICSTAAS